MKLKARAYAIILLSAAFPFALACAAKPRTWLPDGSFVYHAEKRRLYISSAPLAVFADKKGRLYIFDNISKSKTATFSESQFVRELSFISGRHSSERIAVLSFPGADNSKIAEVLDNAGLFKSVEYGFSAKTGYARARTLEHPETVLEFYCAG